MSRHDRRHCPEIVVTSPNARFVVRFDRTHRTCWELEWPAFTDRAPDRFRSLEAALAAVAEFVVETEF